MSGIAFYLKLDYHPDKTQNFILVMKLLEGYRRKCSTKDICLPLTINISENILKVLPVVCTNTFEAKLFAVDYTVVFFWIFTSRTLSTKTLSMSCSSV